MSTISSTTAVPATRDRSAEERIVRAAVALCGKWEAKLDGTKNAVKICWYLFMAMFAFTARAILVQSLRRLDSPYAIVRGWSYLEIATVGRMVVRKGEGYERATATPKSIKKSSNTASVDATELAGSVLGMSFGDISFAEDIPCSTLTVGEHRYRLWIATADNPAEMAMTHVSDAVTDVVRHPKTIEFVNPEFSVRLPLPRFMEFMKELRGGVPVSLFPDTVLVSIAGMRVRTLKIEPLPSAA